MTIEEVPRHNLMKRSQDCARPREDDGGVQMSRPKLLARAVECRAIGRELIGQKQTSSACIAMPAFGPKRTDDVTPSSLS